MLLVFWTLLSRMCTRSGGNIGTHGKTVVQFRYIVMVFRLNKVILIAAEDIKISSNKFDPNIQYSHQCQNILNICLTLPEYVNHNAVISKLATVLPRLHMGLI